MMWGLFAYSPFLLVSMAGDGHSIQSPVVNSQWFNSRPQRPAASPQAALPESGHLRRCGFCALSTYALPLSLCAWLCSYISNWKTSKQKINQRNPEFSSLSRLALFGKKSMLIWVVCGWFFYELRTTNYGPHRCLAESKFSNIFKRFTQVFERFYTVLKRLSQVFERLQSFSNVCS